MTGKDQVADHYTHGTLLDAIRTALEAIGKTPETVTVDDLGPVDEFHIGGRLASEAFLSRLSLNDQMHVLDVGCGLGGASRFAANRFGCRVSGIDLTAEFVATGQSLCQWVGLQDRVTLHHGSALETPFAEGEFDAAFMMHVGMNIPDKAGLVREVARVLKPGGFFGVFDIMRNGEGDLIFPVPWAATPDLSFVDTPDVYMAALREAGFENVTARNRYQFAMDFFAQQRAKVEAAGGPSPLGLHVLMGPSTAEKMANVMENLTAARIAPIELIARKP